MNMDGNVRCRILAHSNHLSHPQTSSVNLRENMKEIRSLNAAVSFVQMFFPQNMSCLIISVIK
jgi:hypothetical protein